MMAVGVANPKAHGQAITNTEIVMVNEKIQVSCPKKNQASPAKTAKTMTIGTNTPETLSAMRAIGALDPWAFSTN